MLDLQHLKTFNTVATTKNFSRAGILLERELGARLFSRRTSKSASA
jgi:DNA-binding transcriptional LysR family regulator